MLKNLIAARKAARMSQEQAAALIGLTQSAYSKIERGDSGLDARAALTLCQRFDLSLESLLIAS